MDSYKLRRRPKLYKKGFSMENTNTDKLIRLPRVMELLGIQRSTVWAWVKSGKIPKGTKLSHKVTVWKESEILAYISSVMD